MVETRGQSGKPSDTPKTKKSVVNPWTEEAKQFFKVVEHTEGDTFYNVAIFTEMRRGALLGLRWEDIDFKQGKIRVVRSLARIKGKGLILKDVKTEASKRQISISPLVVQKLLQYREKRQSLMQ
ncbi:MAG: site-specific integrase [Bacillota bacterium]|nr:site-specific integrase [Bacillota bacterium]